MHILRTVILIVILLQNVVYTLGTGSTSTHVDPFDLLTRETAFFSQIVIKFIYNADIILINFGRNKKMHAPFEAINKWNAF